MSFDTFRSVKHVYPKIAGMSISCSDEPFLDKKLFQLPVASVNFVAMRENVHELADVVRLAHRVGAVSGAVGEAGTLHAASSGADRVPRGRARLDRGVPAGRRSQSGTRLPGAARVQWRNGLNPPQWTHA